MIHTLNKDSYTYIENNDSIILKAKKPDKDGFIINISFTKDEKEHEESMKAIKEFFIREIF